MTAPIRLLLADDHHLVRDVLAQRLATEPGYELVASAHSGDEAVRQAIQQHPDIVLLDIDMPGLDSFEAARAIKGRCPKAAIIFLSAHTHDHYIEQALAVRAAGYLTKADPLATVIAAIDAVAAGGSYYSETVRGRIVVDSDGTHLATRPQSRAATLTPREIEVLRYIAQGLAQKEIANTMHISAKTVHRHSCNFMDKLDIHDRVELTRFAIREGLVKA